MVKSENEWYYECSKSTPQEALRTLRKAWDRCFKKNAGAPKFKKKGRNDSFTLEGTVKILGSNKIQVPVIGVLKTYERLPQEQPKSVTISRTADRWFISFRFEVEPTNWEMGNEVCVTSTDSLRSRVKRKFHARFWRPVGLVRDSLSLIIAAALVMLLWALGTLPEFGTSLVDAEQQALLKSPHQCGGFNQLAATKHQKLALQLSKGE